MSHKTLFVTNALPYANGPIHLGHMLEHIQSDIYVRFQRAVGNEVYYVCGDDCHGTPVMIKAQNLGISPEQLVEQARKSHLEDLQGFLVEYDNFYSTHTPENREISCDMYKKCREEGYITTRTISQLYDPKKQMFLPDRFVKGICPKCGAPDQYGDNCEVCGATYSPTELKDPYSAISGEKPVLRESEHYFFDLPKAEEFLHDFIRHSSVLGQEMSNKLEEWFKEGLKPWDISRDAPYFGFEIPDTEHKYFYVWMDAPIGYLASLKAYCQQHGLEFAPFTDPHSPVEMCHFIGKDILYFHSLFWPGMLHACGMKLPSHIFVHGYVTVNGAKMSKSKGTFIKASTFLKYQRAESLRYYFASKLSSQVVDVDLSLDDYMAKINSDIVGKVVNLASRNSGFIHKKFAGMLSSVPGNPQLLNEIARTREAVIRGYDSRNYHEAIKAIMQLADEANRYIDREAPWILAKEPAQSEHLQQVCSDGLNLFRALVTFLSPVMPQLAAKAAEFLNCKLDFATVHEPLTAHKINEFEPLYRRIEKKDIEQMIEASKEDLKAATPHSTHAQATGTDTEFEPLESEITIDDFAKIDLRVGTILEAQAVEGSAKLIKMQIDLGFEKRQIIGGLKTAYGDPASLIGRQVIVVANLKPRQMKFGLSAGMVTAAGPGGTQIFLLAPDSGAQNGMRVH
ncbi:MAG: methionine--tRNA ligase [Succinivibrio sp.]|nr:methionine--tRNA ligase [Succinivibrio sp.]